MDWHRMRKDDAPPAIRILPADGVGTAASRPPDSGEGRSRRWLTPLIIVGFALLAFVATTRPTPQPEAATAPTTLAPGLSEVSTELIDLRTSAGAVETTNAWEGAPFQWPGRINDVLTREGSLLAIGYDDQGAAAWLSTTGSSWRKVSRFEHSGAPDSSVDHAVVWNGDVVALGTVGNDVSLWTASRLSVWTYHGPVAAMGNNTPIGLAATGKLLAVAENQGRHRGWVSQDGQEWNEIEDVSALDQMDVLSLTGIGDWFYATGQERAVGQAAIYRSQDGVTWERTNGLEDDLLPVYQGEVRDVTATPEGLLAVGRVNDEMVVWRSSDGGRWDRVDHPALQGGTIVIELKGITGANEALVAIDGQERRLVEGSHVLTDVGLMKLVEIGDGSAEVEWLDGSYDRLSIDSEPHTVRLRHFPISVAAQGPRFAVAGWVGIGSPRIPAVWTSADGGDTWSIDYPDPAASGWARAVAITGANITVASGTDGETPQIWHSTWDTSQLESEGVALVEAYFDAIERRNHDAIVDLLPEEPAQFQMPSLAGVALPWWDESSATVDPGAVADTVDYLGELNTQIDLGECRTRTLLGEVDSLRVSCEFGVESDLLSNYSNEDYAGTAEIVVEQGGIQQVGLSTVPSARMWQMLTTGSSSTDPPTNALLDNPDTPELDPTFTPESAPIHVRAAENFIRGLLRPGDTRMVETTFGTMEWSWIDPAPLPVYHVNWITPFEGGFVAIGQGEPERWTQETSLWWSQDGLTWEPMASLPNVTDMWNLQPFRQGLVGQAWDWGRSFIAYYDGENWTEVDLPGGEADGQYFDVRYLATSGDRALVVAAVWDENSGAGPTSNRAWLIVPDDDPREITLPTGFAEVEDSIGLVGSDEGFVLATTQNGSPQSMRMWFSPDGDSWNEIADTYNIENAAYMWNLQRHRGRYFVVGEGTETNCSTSEEATACQPPIGLWSSVDGADWERVFTTSGELVGAYEIGSGPLGMVATAVGFYSDLPLPRPLYLSPDGSTWDRAANLSLIHPSAEWWWLSLPAVGTDTIVIPGSAFLPGIPRDNEVPFIVVGRLIDG